MTDYITAFSAYTESLVGYENAFQERYLEELEKEEDHDLAKARAAVATQSLKEDLRQKIVALETAVTVQKAVDYLVGAQDESKAE